MLLSLVVQIRLSCLIPGYIATQSVYPLRRIPLRTLTSLQVPRVFGRMFWTALWPYTPS